MRTIAWMLVLAGVLPIALAARQGRTVADGVYAAAQADRGRQGYGVFCQSCHADDLSGTNSGDSGAPPLRREGFMEGSTLSGLYTKIRETMPQDAPGALTPQEYVDIVAYVLQQNGFPPGEAELGTDVDVLADIRIVKNSN